MVANLKKMMQKTLKILKECWVTFLRWLKGLNILAIVKRNGLLNRLGSTLRDIWADVILGYLTPKERLVVSLIAVFLFAFFAVRVL